MKLKHLTLITLAALSFAPALAEPAKEQSASEASKLGIIENTANGIKSFFNEQEKRRLKSGVKSLVFLAAACSARKLARLGSPDFLVSFSGDLLAIALGAEAFHQALDTLFVTR